MKDRLITLKQFPTWEKIIKQWDRDNDFYLLLKWELSIFYWWKIYFYDT